MSWVRIDATAPTHPKHLKAGPLACWLWVAGLCYCHEHKTDGFLPVRSLSSLCPLRYPSQSARRLVAVGLWEEVEGGWHVHDYGKFQQSKQDIEKKQAQIHTTRVEAGRRGGKQKAANRASKTTKPLAKENAIQDKTTLSKEQREKSAVTDGPRDGHRTHTFCGKRFCVPRFIHEQFDRQLGSGGPTFDLIGWYPALDRRDDEPVAEILGFLREEFKAAVQQQFGKKSAGQQSSLVDAWAGHEFWTCPHEPHCPHQAACEIVARRIERNNNKEAEAAHENE